MNEELQGVKNELLAAIQQSEDRVLREVTQVVHQVVSQAIHDSETRLLTAFFRWQESSDIKFQRLRADTGNATRAGELRLDNFEARLQELEKRYLTGEDESQ